MPTSRGRLLLAALGMQLFAGFVACFWDAAQFTDQHFK